jgi:putative MFS transporter
MWVGAPETAGRELDRITTDVPDETAATDTERTRA